MNKKKHKPPRIAQWILNRFVSRDIRYSALGDFEESFHEFVMTSSKFKALSWYWRQAAKSIPAFMRDSIQWSVIMFGLASFAAEQRTKEIGIRKVLGASLPGITVLISREFLALVIVSGFIGSPLAYFIMNRWLQAFSFRIDIGIFTFAAAVILALIIALLSVGYQAVKAAVVIRLMLYATNNKDIVIKN